jgi:hypothetical protein
LSASLTALIDSAGGVTQPIPSELAATTAAAVLTAGRAVDDPRVDVDSLVGLADEVGLETLQALWSAAEPATLANSLWVLYVLRSWCARSDSGDVARLWALGEPYASADAVVAGVSVLADNVGLLAAADAILTGAFRGDFAVALERAAAMLRVIAAGRRLLPPSGDAAGDDLDLADRNERAAAALTEAARRWRAGTLR